MSKPAIVGGEPQLARGCQERWKTTRLKDLVPIIKSVWQDSNTEVGGPATRMVEQGFRTLTGTRHALAVNSGTAALHSAFVAVGVRPGHEVIVPSYTFFASAAPILQCGGRPVFCDIDPETLTADPDDVEKRITSRTKAICAVHVWGNPARIDRLLEIAHRHDVALIEDCSHAHGASFQGRPVGSWGDIGCFSLQGLKSVSGGEAGVITTSDDLLYDRMLVLGHNGRTSGGQKTGAFDVGSMSFGLKYRPHKFAMCLVNASLSRLPELNQLREQNLSRLSELISGEPALVPIRSYDGAKRGGFLEYLFRFNSEQCGNWNAGAFAKAVAAEGVPIYPDRYSNQAAHFFTLHQAGMFSTFQFEGFGGAMSKGAGDGVQSDLPHTDKLTGTLIAMSPLTDVPDGTIEKVAAAICKVAEFARSGQL